MHEMTVVEIVSPGGPERLKTARRPVPALREGEVLVEVRAAGVNRPDVLQRQGKYPPPPGATDIPGLEIAGVVREVAPGVTAWRQGAEICALVAGGGYAEWCAVPAEQCLPVPAGLDFNAAASLPETYFTVWANLFDEGRPHLRAGETLLVHGGTSGIGVTAIQLARAFGATVYATAGSEEKCRACEQLGATLAINYRTEGFVAIVRKATEGRGVDVVLDMVGGPYLGRNLDVLAVDGRLIQVGLLGGARAEIHLTALMQRRAILTGSTLRPRSIAEKGVLASALRERVWPLLESGAVRPVVHAVFPLAQAADAHRLMESGTHIGKIVLTTGRGPAKTSRARGGGER